MTKEITPEQRKFDVDEFFDFVDGFGLEPWQGTQFLDWLRTRGWTAPEHDINLNEMFPEAKVFTLQFENGNSVEMPVGQLLPGSAPVEVLSEEEWRDIDSIPGLKSFQVSDIGRIRYKHNDRVIEPSFDCLTNKHYVKLKVNGKDLWIDGPVLAASMWEH